MHALEAPPPNIVYSHWTFFRLSTVVARSISSACRVASRLAATTFCQWFSWGSRTSSVNMSRCFREVSRQTVWVVGTSSMGMDVGCGCHVKSCDSTSIKQIRCVAKVVSSVSALDLSPNVLQTGLCFMLGTFYFPVFDRCVL